MRQRDPSSSEEVENHSNGSSSSEKGSEVEMEFFSTIHEEEIVQDAETNCQLQKALVLLLLIPQ